MLPLPVCFNPWILVWSESPRYRQNWCTVCPSAWPAYWVFLWGLRAFFFYLHSCACEIWDMIQDAKAGSIKSSICLFDICTKCICSTVPWQKGKLILFGNPTALCTKVQSLHTAGWERKWPTKGRLSTYYDNSSGCTYSKLAQCTIHEMDSRSYMYKCSVLTHRSLQSDIGESEQRPVYRLHRSNDILRVIDVEPWPFCTTRYVMVEPLHHVTWSQVYMMHFNIYPTCASLVVCQCARTTADPGHNRSRVCARLASTPRCFLSLVPSTIGHQALETNARHLKSDEEKETCWDCCKHCVQQQKVKRLISYALCRWLHYFGADLVLTCDVHILNACFCPDRIAASYNLMLCMCSLACAVAPTGKVWVTHVTCDSRGSFSCCCCCLTYLKVQQHASGSL